ncbi:hypothetical protein OB920_05460 [Halobacteria archaeon HArc-gm2]|nr:hypothetical protein [Halobacteria archaeon HArc-gm2]
MKRRKALSVLLGGGAAATLGGVAVFKPDLITGPPRTQGDPISLGERHQMENVIEYHSSNHTVTHLGPGSHPRIETNSFRKWAKMQSETIAKNAVLEATKSRFDGDLTGINMISSRHYLEEAICIFYIVNAGQLQDMEAPNVPFEAILERAPKKVDLTLVLEGNEYEAEYPVVARRHTVDLIM